MLTTEGARVTRETGAKRKTHSDSEAPGTRARAIRALSSVEWAGWSYLLYNLASTDRFYLRSPNMRVLFVVLLTTYTALLTLSLRRLGPFSRGPKGFVFGVAMSVLPVVAFGVLLPLKTYQARLPYELPMANNMFPSALFLAVYSRSSGTRGHEWARIVFDYASVGLLIPFFGLVALINGYALRQIRWVNLSTQATTTLVAVAMGQGLWRVIRDFSDAEVKAADSQHDGFSAWLHSEALGTLAAVRRLCSDANPDVGRVMRCVEDLDQAIRSRRHALALNQDSVAVADVVAHNVRRFRSAIAISSPGMAGWSMAGDIAHHFDRLLGDLLANAVQAGAKNVAIHVHREQGGYSIAVIDDGPGLPDGVLDQPETSLGRLVLNTAELGGWLRGARLEGGRGTQLVAFLPSTRFS